MVAKLIAACRKEFEIRNELRPPANRSPRLPTLVVVYYDILRYSTATSRRYMLYAVVYYHILQYSTATSRRYMLYAVVYYHILRYSTATSKCYLWYTMLSKINTMK